MGGHAVLAPSAAHRWMRCPGSVHLCEQVDDPGSIHADEGTFAHRIAASALTTDKPAKHYLGAKSGCHRFQVDDAMVGHLQSYLNVVHGIRQLMVDECHAWAIEKRVDWSESIWGTADALVWDATDLHIIDLKFGAGVYVEVEGNSQLLIYAVCALNSLLTPDERKTIRNVHMHVVQPRHHASPKWRRSTTTRQALENWEIYTLGPAAMATKSEHLMPGETQCQFCPAKAVCPAIREHAMEKAQAAFAGKALPAPCELTPELIGETLAAFPLIEDWMKAVREHAHEQARRCVDIPGYKLVKKVGRRAWTDEEAAAEQLELLGVNPYDRKMKSPAQAEKALGKGGENVVALLAHKPDAGTDLVPESDKRKRYSPAAAFPVIPDEEESQDGQD